MANIRPKDLPAAASVTGTDDFILDTGAQVLKAKPAQIVDAATPLASQAEAEAGTDNSKRMSPLRVKQAITAQAVIPDLLAGTTGASQVGTIATGAGAVGRTVQDKLDEIVSVKDFGATGDGVEDDAPAFRLARDAIVARGGGKIFVPAGTYNLASSETRTVWNLSAFDYDAILFLDAGVSLVGEPGAKLDCSIFGIQGIIIPVDYSNGKVSDLEIEGNGDQTSQHGILIVGESDYSHVMENVEFSDLYIHDVGSYGLGNTLQCRNIALRNIRTKNTGADGIDWKIRGVDSLDIVAEGLEASKIFVSDYGKRVGAGTPTGTGWRGPWRIDGIEVFGATAVLPGIQLVAGIADSATSDYRPNSSRASITNWYVEGADAKGDNLGLMVYASDAVTVGAGVAKHCSVFTAPDTSTPYAVEDGPTFTGVVCIPSHGRDAFKSTAESVAWVGCRVISDKAYFDAKRDNLTAGQTVFTLPWATTTSSGAPRLIYKNGTLLTITTDYTWDANGFTLVSPVLSTDELMVVFAPVRGFRAEADYCQVVSCRQDRHITNTPSFLTQQNYDTGILSGFMWDGHKGISEVNSASIAGIQSADPTAADKAFRIQAKGAGTLEIGSGANLLKFFTSGGAAKQTITGSRGSNAALASLLDALEAYGLITDSTS